MRRGFTKLALALGVGLALPATALMATAPPAAAERAQNARAERQCALPEPGEPAETAAPEEVQLDPVAVRQALAYANTHLRTSVRIFRHNCQVGTGLLDPVTELVPYNIWSSTKSVVSVLAGIAYDQGRLDLDAPIGRYLPAGPGWGDAEHRAITVRQLLTQTSGLREAILAEGATTGLDPNVAKEALAQPIEYEPGSRFEYSQRVADLMAYVVQRAVGQDLQAFAQQNLFDPIGVPSDGYFWLRDRSGNSYGYAHLFMAPKHFARLGLLLQNEGTWNGHRVLSTDYIGQLREPSSTNGCYGFMFWVNAGRPCTGANIPKAQTVPHRMTLSAPKDLYAMAGALQQNNFVIPSLDMTVSWTGAFGDTSLNLSDLASASPGADLYHEFFRILLRGVEDVHVPDPGPYRSPPLDLDIDPTNYADPRVLLTDLAPHPSCNVLFCDGTVPTEGLLQNGEAILGSVRGVLSELATLGNAS